MLIYYISFFLEPKSTPDLSTSTTRHPNYAGGFLRVRGGWFVNLTDENYKEYAINLDLKPEVHEIPDDQVAKFLKDEDHPQDTIKDIVQLEMQDNLAGKNGNNKIYKS